jgi:outer membrane immunogenic protein
MRIKQMRKIIVALLAATTLGVGAAAAADISRRAPAPVYSPAPVFSWAGFYVGANAGYSWGSTDIGYSTPYAAPSMTTHPDSFIGGGQIGYNWQTGLVVWGLETDIAWRHGSDDATFLFGAKTTANAPFGTFSGDNAAFHTEQNWLGTVRGRIGYAAGSWLPYVTGGLAYGNVKHSITETLGAPNQANTRTISESTTKAGWTVGAGVDYAFAGPWSLGLEYLYVDLGTSTLNQPAQTNRNVFAADSASFKDTSHIVRARINYKFAP